MVAPAAVSTTLVCPIHTAVAGAVAVTVGFAITDTVMTAGDADTQLLVEVPLTEYIVVDAGVTTLEALIAAPLREYVVAPEGRIVYDWPAQMLPLVALRVGVVLTASVAITLAETQLLVPVAITV